MACRKAHPIELRDEERADAASHAASPLHPIHPFWLNQVKPRFSILCRKVIRREMFPSVQAPVEATTAFIQLYQQGCRPSPWTLTPDRLEAIVITRAGH